MIVSRTKSYEDTAEEDNKLDHAYEALTLVGAGGHHFSVITVFRYSSDWEKIICNAKTAIQAQEFELPDITFKKCMCLNISLYGEGYAICIAPSQFEYSFKSV